MEKKENKTKFKHNKWNKAEDAMLRLVMTNVTKPNWNEISKRFLNRNARQCQERWTNYLSPTVNNDPWTEQEDELLKQKYNELGSKWSLIARFFTNRTNTNVKNRWIALNRIASKASINKESNDSTMKTKNSNFEKEEKFIQEEIVKNDVDPTKSLLNSLKIPYDEINEQLKASQSKKLLPSIHQTTGILNIKNESNNNTKPKLSLISNQSNFENKPITYELPSHLAKMFW